MSVPVITLTSPFKTIISHPPEIGTNARDASFSSYLDGAEESFVLKLGSKNTQISPPNDHIFLGKTKTETDDKELDVFDAEKYFNEANQSPKIATARDSPPHHPKKDEPLEIFAIKDQPSKPTLSVRSESSWNSRSALLHNVPKYQQTRRQYKKSFLASIAYCNCSCADKNSVDIDDESCPNRSKQGTKIGDHLVRKSLSSHDSAVVKLEKSDHFTFPVFTPLNQGSENDAAKRKKSLEVFGSPIQENGKMCSGLEKALAITTWDAIAPNPQEEIKISIPSVSSDMRRGDNDDDEDSDSDVSSDLFEIESFSRGNNSTACYAPSEASIEWSVVTASAADHSVLSDSDDLISDTPKKGGSSAKIASFKEMPRLRSGLLSGCKSQKAVEIAGDAVKVNDHHGFGSARRAGLRSESFTRFRDGSKISTFDARNSRQQSFDARILSQPRHGNGAHLLYA